MHRRKSGNSGSVGHLLASTCARARGARVPGGCPARCLGKTSVGRRAPPYQGKPTEHAAGRTRPRQCIQHTSYSSKDSSRQGIIRRYQTDTNRPSWSRSTQNSISHPRLVVHRPSPLAHFHRTSYIIVPTCCVYLCTLSSVPPCPPNSHRHPNLNLNPNPQSNPILPRS